ncbi:hypothetical protein PMAYCL1PPCAC_27720, partial [Pristionchus mayeri]
VARLDQTSLSLCRQFKVVHFIIMFVRYFTEAILACFIMHTLVLERFIAPFVTMVLFFHRRIINSTLRDVEQFNSVMLDFIFRLSDESLLLPLNYK